jgi:ubiquinone/menaquinone biosynthesis C-methylase UbiE
MESESRMTDNNQKPDWSEEHWREALVEQRKAMWLDDTIEKLAAWLELRPGMTIIDVGCGLGYLGNTYWPYFGHGGRYVGIDISDKLLEDAAKAAGVWAIEGEADFVKGDAYQLLFPDCHFDAAMCQTLLMHLEHPKRALAEMIRVTKPGGLIFCQEPDNLSSALAKGHSSLPEWDIDERLLLAKFSLMSNMGRIKLGRGDISAGARVPRMMNELGLRDISARMNDKVQLLEPPYESPRQQQLLRMVKANWFDDERRKYWQEREKEEFLAGGGTLDEWKRIVQIVDKLIPVYRQQLADGEFFLCGGTFFYIIKGRKPIAAD